MYAQKEKSYIWDVIITCVVLGGCGLILIPMWKREKAEMMETDLHSGLGLIRAQLPLYNKQHDNRWPGENIANQMTELTSLEGFTWSELLEGDERPPSYPFGPLQWRFPGKSLRREELCDDRGCDARRTN